MIETAFEPSDGAAFAVGLLNTWDELEPDPECLRDVGFVQRLLTRHGFTDAARVAREQDVDWLRSLRERLAPGATVVLDDIERERGDGGRGTERDPRGRNRPAVARA